MGGTNKVRQLLSDEEISALFDDLRSMPGMNGPAFAGLMREKGYVLGHNAANHFIQNEFKPYLESLKRQKALAIFLTENSDPENGATIADAAANKLSQDIFDFIHEADFNFDLNSEDGREKATALSRMLQQLRAGDHKLVEMRMKLREVEEKNEAARQLIESPKTKGVSPEARAAFRKVLGLVEPEKPCRASVPDAEKSARNKSQVTPSDTDGLQADGLQASCKEGAAR